jgi:hypothetical protein
MAMRPYEYDACYPIKRCYKLYILYIPVLGIYCYISFRERFTKVCSVNEMKHQHESYRNQNAA